MTEGETPVSELTLTQPSSFNINSHQWTRPRKFDANQQENSNGSIDGTCDNDDIEPWVRMRQIDLFMGSYFEVDSQVGSKKTWQQLRNNWKPTWYVTVLPYEMPK